MAGRGASQRTLDAVLAVVPFAEQGRGLRHREIAARLTIVRSPITVRHALSELIDAGLVIASTTSSTAFAAIGERRHDAHRRNQRLYLALDVNPEAVALRHVVLLDRTLNRVLGVPPSHRERHTLGLPAQQVDAPISVGRLLAAVSWAADRRDFQGTRVRFAHLERGTLAHRSPEGWSDQNGQPPATNA